jgi:hypothetical protein
VCRDVKAKTESKSKLENNGIADTKRSTGLYVYSRTKNPSVRYSLAPRYQSQPGECSVYSCLNQFTQSELLTGEGYTNLYKCQIVF